MKRITLISKEQAEIGHRFRLVNIPDECKSCRLYNVCMGKLTPGRSYQVIEVRAYMGQRCKITGGEMVPVVVEEAPIVGLLPPHKALEGVVVTFEEECAGCEGCPTDVVKRGEKVKVVKVLGKKMCKSKEFFIVEFFALGLPEHSKLNSTKSSQVSSPSPLSKPPSKVSSPRRPSPR
ncbi:MAG: UPF0179 family protein [Pyrobaculum sp.]